MGKLRNSYEPKGCDGKRRISQEAGALHSVRLAGTAARCQCGMTGPGEAGQPRHCLYMLQGGG